MSAAACLKPEEVYLCVLCHYFVHPPAVDQATGAPLPPLQSSQRIALFLLKLLKGSPSATYPTLDTLCDMLMAQLGALGRELVRQLGIILQGLASPDDLTNVMDAIGGLLVGSKPSAALGTGRPAGILPSSILGLFLRRVRAAFQLAPYQLLLSTTAALQADLHAAAVAAGGGQNTDSATGAPPTSPPRPPPSLRCGVAIEQYLNHLIKEVDRKGMAAWTADDQTTLQRIHQSYNLGSSALGMGREGGTHSGAGSAARLAPGVLPRTLSLELTTAMAEGDFPRALHHLHAYFDTAQAAQMVPPLCDPSVYAGGAAATGKARHQSSLLSRAALHARLGHTSEAMHALGEALRASQQAGDAWTDLHVLALLCHLTLYVAPGSPGLPTPGLAALKDGGQEVQAHALLTRCLARATEMGCPHLAVFARLGLAAWGLQHTQQELLGSAPVDCPAPPGPTSVSVLSQLQGSKPRAAARVPGTAVVPAEEGAEGPGRAADSLFHASPAAGLLGAQQAYQAVAHVAHHAWLEAATRPHHVTTTAGGGAAAAGAAASLGAQALRAAPAVPELYGPPRLLKQPATWATCSSSATMTLQHAGSGLLMQAAAWASGGHVTLAAVAVVAYLAAHGAHSRAEDTDVALAQLVGLVAQSQGPLAGREAATIALGALPPGRPPSTVLQGAALAAEHEAACAQGAALSAARAAAALRRVCSPTGHVEAPTRLLSMHCDALGLLAEGDMAGARDAALRCFHAAREQGHPAWATRSLLTLGRVWLRAGDASKAQPYLHSCLLHARAARMDVVAAQASLLLAQAWVAHSPALLRPVLAQLQVALPVLCAHGGVGVRGEMAWVLATCQLDCPEQEAFADRIAGAKPAVLLETAAECLERAGDLDRACQAALLLALLSDKMALYSARDAAAGRVLRIRAAQRRAKLGAC